MPWYFHPESDCYFFAEYPLGMEGEAANCHEVAESEVPDHIRKDKHMNTIDGTAVRVQDEATASRAAVGDDSMPPGAVANAADIITNDKLVKLYIKIRDAKSAFVKAHEAELAERFEKPLAQIQTELKVRCQSMGNTGLKTDYGTVYLAETMKVSCGDWGVFHDWIKKNDALDMLEQRVKVGEVKTYMETHGGELPPGLSVFKELEARVRKPTKRGEKAVDDGNP